MKLNKTQKIIMVSAILLAIILGVIVLVFFTNKSRNDIDKQVEQNEENVLNNNEIQEEETTPVVIEKNFREIVNDLKGKARTAEEYFQLGVAYYNLRKLEDAEKSYQSAINLDSGNARYYGNLGNTYREMSQFGKAEESYKKAIALDPQNSKFYVGLAFLYANFMNNKEAAITVLNQGLAEISDSEEIKNLLAEYQK